MPQELLSPPFAASSAEDERHRVDDALDSGSICPLFQAIVDLWTGDLCGYEALSRPSRGFKTIGALLGAGSRLGLRWAVESACRRSLFHTLAGPVSLPGGSRLFLNVSPGVFLDPRFSPELLLEEGLGGVLPLERLVVELTEGEPIDCMTRFRHQRESFERQGVELALDDFGGGHNGLSSFRQVQPNWLKLDMDLVRGIGHDVPGQEVIRSLRRMAAALDIGLVAEGVETEDELRALAGIGVRYVQGFLLQRPQQQPMRLVPEVTDTVHRLMSWVQDQTVSEEHAISAVHPAHTIEPDTLRGFELDEIFRHAPELDHVVLASQGRPLGLITRNHYSRCASGHFGFPLIQKRWVDAAADRDALVVPGRTDLATATAMAMGRCNDRIYDPVIVVDEKGLLVGTMTIKALLGRSTELRVNSALSANPLTGLPGNSVIDRWLDECLCQDTFTIIYADLDQFKAYNDTYGFGMGDRMIELVAEQLVAHAREMPGKVRVGHIGGDDFVLLVDSPLADEPLDAICREFDQRCLGLFTEEHRQNGGYVAVGRQGKEEFHPLVTLSLAVVDQNAFPGIRPHRARFAAVAASLKKRLKEDASRAGRSGFMRERRTYSA